MDAHIYTYPILHVQRHLYIKACIFVYICECRCVYGWTRKGLKILKEMVFGILKIPNHLTCLLRNLYAGQEATVRTGRGTTDWFQIGKEVRQNYILSPTLFN